MGKLNDTIREAIKGSDQTPYAIAKATGVSRSQLSRLLSGLRELDTNTIEKLANYLGLEIIIRPVTKRKAR